MRPAPDRPPDDLSQLTDDDLVLRARGPGGDRAWEELARRDQGHLARLVAWLARRCGVVGADREDLRQEAALAQLKAIHRYDPHRPAHYPFLRFCRRVVLRDLRNYLRGGRRAEKHLDRSPRATAVLEIFPAPVASGRDRGPSDSEPVWEVQQREQHRRIEQAVQWLDDPERRLLDGLTRRATRVQIAAERGVAYGVIRGDTRRLMKKLQALLAGL